jgi:hypothetical protein
MTDMGPRYRANGKDRLILWNGGVVLSWNRQNLNRDKRQKYR